MIEFSHVTAGYGKTTVLRDISLTFPRGEVSVLLGPNGCGKSTMLKTLLGMAQLEAGCITVSGKPLSSYDSAALAREISYLPQSRRVPDMTVQRLVLHGRFPYLSYPRRYRAEDYAIARQAMEQLQIAPYAQTELSHLSGGTRQRAYIAMALAQDTDAILLDEPNASLDIAHQLQLMELCRELAGCGKAVVTVLHDLNLAMEYAHRIAVLKDGQLLASGPAEDVYRSSALDRAFCVHTEKVETAGGTFYRSRLQNKE